MAKVCAPQEKTDEQIQDGTGSHGAMTRIRIPAQPLLFMECGPTSGKLQHPDVLYNCSLDSTGTLQREVRMTLQS